ncbi:MAG: SufS family cysteine desulfurase, partial [bacterium]|nr:SufS family cysteine desulfurase [bacterium]
MDPKKLKLDFPVFANNPGLVYLDSTATALKPQRVIDGLREYYEKYSANVFRGLYPLSAKATEEYELSRQAAAEFIGARTEEIVFTRNTTESLNLVAYILFKEYIKEDDEVVSTMMEHHSNFVPWQQMAFERSAVFKVIDIDNDGFLEVVDDGVKVNKDSLARYITKRTKVFAFTLISNVLGVINPAKELIKAAKEINPDVIVVVDGAQGIPHTKVDVSALGADFLAFSSHKMLGPTGVGVLWGRKELLEKLPPFLYGGEMIKEVSVDGTTFADLPHKYEAGTPSIGEVIAFKQAVAYLQEVGLDNIARHEEKLVGLLQKRLEEEFGDEIVLIGPRADQTGSRVKAGILAFSFGKYHPHDVAEILASEKIAVRAGHHCAQPLHCRLDMNASVRASFYLYNTEDDVEALVEGLKKVKRVL